MFSQTDIYIHDGKDAFTAKATATVQLASHYVKGALNGDPDWIAPTLWLHCQDEAGLRDLARAATEAADAIAARNAAALPAEAA